MSRNGKRGGEKKQGEISRQKGSAYIGGWTGMSWSGASASSKAWVVRLREVEPVEMSEAHERLPLGHPLATTSEPPDKSGETEKPVCGQIKAVNVKADSAVAAGRDWERGP